MHLTYRWRATLVIALGLLMSVLDVTIVSVVLPQIATALHADYQTSTWIGDGDSVAGGETACQSHHAGGIWRTLLVPNSPRRDSERTHPQNTSAISTSMVRLIRLLQ